MYRNSHFWSTGNPHSTVERVLQHRFSVNVCCGLIGDQLTGPFVVEQRLIADKYLDFLKNELPLLMEDTPLETMGNLHILIFKVRLT
jgi:hypothetical protein